MIVSHVGRKVGVRVVEVWVRIAAEAVGLVVRSSKDGKREVEKAVNHFTHTS